MRRRILSAVLVVVAFGGLTEAAGLGFASEGTIGWAMPLVALELEAAFALTYSDDAFTTTLTLDVDATEPTELIAKTGLSGEAWELAATLGFDVPSASFGRGELVLSASLALARLEIGLMRDDGGIGVTVALVPSAAGLLRSFALGLNVDRYGRVQTEGCDLEFTYAEVETGFSCDCADVGATALFTSDGFSELVLTAADVGGLALGIELGVNVQYTVAAKTLEVVPSFTAENPECFDLYLGLVWDAPTKTLEGISLYGLGMACEIDAVRVRGLWELDSDRIALVKAPYWALLGLVWDVAAPCDRASQASVAEASVAEASVAFFFSDEGLFDLGEVQFGLEWPIAPGWTATLSLGLETSGAVSLVVGWTGESR